MRKHLLIIIIIIIIINIVTVIRVRDTPNGLLNECLCNWFDSRQRQPIFLCFTLTSALVFTQPPVQWLSGPFPVGNAAGMFVSIPS
jgi:hypothetical protein